MKKINKNYKLFFWQNTNSIHQAAFFRQISKDPYLDVSLIVCQPLSSERIAMGWKDPELEDTIVLRMDDNLDWKKIIEQNKDENCIHIFSGIAAFPPVHKAFRYACSKSCRIAVLSESLDFRGYKGFLRKIRGYLHHLIYKKSIEFILSIGWEAKEQFILWGYNRNRVNDWAYTLDKSTVKEYREKEQEKQDLFRIIYVGSMYPWKGYDLLIDSLDTLTDIDFTAELYCISNTNEDKKNDLQNRLNQKDKISLLTFLNNTEIRSKISESDLLVLPSRYDGWGAVISESLLEGTPVLVSKNCGAAQMVDNNAILGSVICPLSVFQIKNDLVKIITQGKVTKEKRQSIKEWAENNISADAMAFYFKKILSYYDGQLDDKPVAPWLKK